MAKGIILHDYFRNAEGGGRVSLAIAQGLGIDICYGFRAQNHPYFANFPTDIHQYDLQVNIPYYGLKQLALAYAFANKTQFLQAYDYIIYSGFYCPYAIKNAVGKRNILYCHTPPRYIYDQREFYLSRMPKWQRPLFLAAIKFLQPRYERAFAKMDRVLTNSEYVKARIKKYLNKEAIVVYPPCDTAAYKWLGQQDYYLSTARLDPLKRVDLIVEAFIKMPDKELIVASGGSELQTLQERAKNSPNITFTGWIEETKLQQLIGNALATIYIPRQEDFGLSPIESMAAGKPVIGVSEGGIKETVIDGVTGILLPENPQLDELVNAVTQLDRARVLAMRSACEKRAEEFNQQTFFANLKRAINL